MKIKNIFLALTKTQKFFVFLLVLTVIGSLYYNAMYKPKADLLKKYTLELSALNKNIIKLKNQAPDIEKEKKILEALEKSRDSLNEKIFSFEEGLPSYTAVSGLLSELVRQAQNQPIDFISIKPKISKDNKEYAELSLEIKINSTYSGFVNYLNRLESFSGFLKAADMLIQDAKEITRGEIDAEFTLTTLIAEKEVTLGKKPKMGKIAAPFKITRSPFISKYKPVKPADIQKEELHLAGIINRGKDSTVIINNEVYHLGDKIGDRIIKEIFPDKVILESSRGSTILTLEK